jgi:hypothetical protein
LANNTHKIKTVYTCQNIVDAYAVHFEAIKLKDAKILPALPNAAQVALYLENAQIS